MVDRPIIFSAPMVRALLEGRKTMTRRLAWKNKATWTGGPVGACYVVDPSPWQRVQPGDRLWVRENWQSDVRNSGTKPNDIRRTEPVWFAAGGEPINGPGEFAVQATGWRPSIHMPRWASRLTLTVTAVKVERLQDISEADAIAEGVEPPETERECRDWSICQKCGGTGTHGALGEHMGVTEVDCSECDTACRRFRNLWNSLHGSEAWDANPEVVAVSFTVERRNVDAR